MASRELASISLTPGMTLEIKIPVSVDSGGYPNGSFPSLYNEINMAGSEKTLMNGYSVENDIVGHLELMDDGISIRYVHEKPYPNRIFYHPVVSEDVYVISIVAVTVHDHSSMSQGGPAYGTYFTDYTPEPTGENP